MDAPPPKRRRTSPRLAGRASSDGPDVAAGQTAASNNNDNDNSNSTSNAPPDLPPAPRSEIPLFASPTRASLARHNPEILERRRSTSRGPSIADRRADSARTPPPPPANNNGRYENRNLDGGKGGAEKTATIVRPLQQPAVRSPTRSRRSAVPQSPPRGLSRSPTRSPTRRLGSLFSEPPVQSPLRGQQQQKTGGGGGSMLTEPPRRTPLQKPVPRPLPPPEPTRAEDVLEPLIAAARERQRRVAAAGGGGLDLFRGPQEDPPEPELPPTPEHPDPELTTSPPGIHNANSSTPSKRPAGRRSGHLRSGKTNAPSSSSPLKQPPLKPPVSGAVVAKPVFSNTAAQKKAKSNDKQVAIAATGDGSLLSDNHRKSPVTISTAVRGIKPPDPDAAKKKERDALLAEIAELETDLALAATENERIRKAMEEANSPEERSAVSRRPPPPHVRDDLLGLLRRRAPALASDKDHPAGGDTQRESTMASWLQEAANPIALLPFGKPSGADGLSALLSIVEDFSSREREDAAAAIASHRPLPMTADEELPYLQAFTPLAFSSHIFLLPTTLENNITPGTTTTTPLPPPLLQKHRITIASTHPHSLFRARIDMTVNTKSLRVTDLRVPRIEPLAAADELQPLLARCGVATEAADAPASIDSSSSSALLRNVTIVTWAMGEWVRVAVRRARFWVALERRLKEIKTAGGVAGATARCPRRRKRKRRDRQTRHSAESGEDEDSGDSEDGSEDDNGDDDDFVVSEAELLTHAGRTAMDAEVPFEESSLPSGSGSGGRGLRVQWTIHFDWTGEARSQIGLLVGVPGKWRKADDRGRLATLPRLFDQLVQGNTDPVTAVETVVALLAGRE